MTVESQDPTESVDWEELWSCRSSLSRGAIKRGQGESVAERCDPHFEEKQGTLFGMIGSLLQNAIGWSEGAGTRASAPVWPRTSGLTSRMYAIVRKVVIPPRTSRPSDEPLGDPDGG